ncbi:thioredoxin-like protein [Terfezia boudieri ATCC MYA-4762]|uniref:Thioredoxin-like protein n=1 Tax=Terfezia boudieri ATCC MYA-4762 TaxID=1051890 RepID=A0A3N4LGU4_9PEZI|nr:thioredoxin-like protein [Terfezia boudieri ATCC MYA-4762]
MKFSALTALYILPSVLAQQESKEQIIYNLTSENFESFITSHPLALIDFYTTWCIYCTRLSPKLELAATMLQGLELEVPVVVGKVDCTTKRLDRRGIIPFCEDIGVTSLPSLKVYRQGVFQEDYRGPSTAEDITKFMVGESKKWEGTEKGEIQTG